MAIGGNTNLIALTGILQQKNALAAYNRQASRAEFVRKTGAEDTHSLGTTEKQAEDTATLSRAAISALENTQVIGEETVIRGDDSATDALDMSQKLILEHTEEALRAQVNVTPERLLALYQL